MKYLAFDYGTQKTGLAVGSSVASNLTQPQPLPPLKMKNGRADEAQLQKVINEWRPDAFLLGLPQEPDFAATESESSSSPVNLAKRIKSFAEFLNRKFSKPCYFIDERLSSRAAQSDLKQAGVARPKIKKNLDSVVAGELLREWLADPRSKEDEVRETNE